MAIKIGRIVPKTIGKAMKSAAKGAKTSSPQAANPSPEGKDDYMARDDAQTVARAHAIKSDPVRREAASRAASKMADEKAAELRGLRSIAGRKK